METLNFRFYLSRDMIMWRQIFQFWLNWVTKSVNYGIFDSKFEFWFSLECWLAFLLKDWSEEGIKCDLKPHLAAYISTIIKLFVSVSFPYSNIRMFRGYFRGFCS